MDAVVDALEKAESRFGQQRESHHAQARCRGIGQHHRPLQPALSIAHLFIEVVEEIWLLLHGRGIVSGRLQKWAKTHILRSPKGLPDRQ